MAARGKSKKTTKSKAKKTRSASSAKTASKRVKEASSSSVRSRVGKSKPTSSARAARKTIRAKMKNIVAKPSKRKRKSPSAAAATASRTRGAAKRLAKAASARKPAASKGSRKVVKSATAARAASVARAHAKEAAAKSVLGSRGAQAARTPPEKVVTAVAGPKPGPAHVHIAVDSTESTSTAKSAAPAVRVQKPGGADEAVAKSLKTAGQRQGFKLNEFVVYPAHGVGQIVSIEEQEVAGFRLELFVISFSKDKLTLRVPTSKVSGVGMRKISDPDTARRSLEILTGRARVKRTMWSRRAQEYETKINSGDINAIAEVVRDLYRSEAQPEQSYSERQLYEAALDRMVREIAAVQKSNEIDALKTVETQLQKGQSRASKSAGPQSAGSEIEQAA
jgi:CarD family transcriptional regulator